MKQVFRALFTVTALTLATATAPLAFAAGEPSLAQLKRELKEDRARCMRGESNQDRATCLKEANAAYDEARRGRLESANASSLERNATKRCEAQPPAERPACVQRILGAGNTQGSVGGGGLIRRSETKTP